VSFSSRRALAVCWKDLLDLRRSPALLASMLVLPAVMVAVPVGVVWAYARNPSDPSLRAMALFYREDVATQAQAVRFLLEKTLSDWFGLFLTMPVFVPILISSQSVAGEKERRTLEPLLASPVTAAELLAGKSLAALVPAVLISWAAFVLLCVGVDVVAWPLVGEALLPNGLWAYGVLVIAPLFAFFGNGVAVLVSARVGDARLAQQLSALVVLPLVGLVAAQVAGWLTAGPAYYAVQGGVVAALDVGLVVAGVRLFDRERLVSRWG
jgi:ABC-2 type transport system permease protein